MSLFYHNLAHKAVRPGGVHLGWRAKSQNCDTSGIEIDRQSTSGFAVTRHSANSSLRQAYIRVAGSSPAGCKALSTRMLRSKHRLKNSLFFRFHPHLILTFRVHVCPVLGTGSYGSGTARHVLGEKFGTQGTAPGIRGTSAPGGAVGAKGIWFQLFL